MDFNALNHMIPPPDTTAIQNSKEKWDKIAKPLGSLGLLETAITKIAGITGSADVTLNRRAVLVLCSDNGVVEEGVTQTAASVTMAVAKNLVNRGTSVCKMAKAANCDVVPVDMGMFTEPDFDGMINFRVASGTKNFAKEPAMTTEQAETAVNYGIKLAEEMKKSGYNIIAVGEMGIGNTTTATAIICALTGADPEELTGRGSGLSDESLKKKIATIKNGIKTHITPDSGAIDILAALGGFDIAGKAGIIIGAALHRLPVILDGIISVAAALVAVRLCPRCIDTLIASHVSGVKGGGYGFDILGLRPIIHAEMRLGEGTGAVALLPLLDLALAVYNGGSDFSEIGVEQYTPQEI